MRSADSTKCGKIASLSLNLSMIILAPAAGWADNPKVVPSLVSTAKNPVMGDWNPVPWGRISFFPVEDWKISEKTIEMKAGQFNQLCSYKLDVKTAPRSIDLTVLDGPDKGKSYPGIFSRDGDYLEVCYDTRANAKRPRAFVTSSDLGGNRSLIFVKVPATSSESNAARVGLKMIGNALHGYQQGHGTLPPANVTDPLGNPLSSWRLLVCPFIHQGAVFAAFRLNQAWDSPSNLEVSLVRIKTYYWGIDPNDRRSLTRCRAFAGKGTLFEGATGQKFPASDALSTTVLVVEALQPVPWTKPEELSYESDRPLPALGGTLKGGFHVLLADGSVRFVKEGFNERVFRQMILREKAKGLAWDDLHRE